MIMKIVMMMTIVTMMLTLNSNDIQERTNLANGGVQGPVNQSGYLISLFLTYLKALSSNLISKLLKMKKKNIIDPGIMKQLRKAG